MKPTLSFTHELIWPGGRGCGCLRNGYSFLNLRNLSTQKKNMCQCDTGTTRRATVDSKNVPCFLEEHHFRRSRSMFRSMVFVFDR